MAWIRTAETALVEQGRNFCQSCRGPKCDVGWGLKLYAQL